MYTPAQITQIAPVPLIAWPTVILLLVCCATEVSVLFLLHAGHISRYAALAINTIAVYGVFTPMHDASHGSIGSKQFSFLNFVAGNLAGFCFPVPFPAFKHIHLLHHKHTNEEEDPDKWAGTGPSFLLPLRWLTMELKYYAIYLPKLHTRPRAEAIWSIAVLLGMIASIRALYYHGYGDTILWGWILPGRLATALLACFFDYLPHRPHKVSRHESPFVATNVTSLTGELTSPLTWPLLHQNYHNIHHLAPYIPFYMYSTVWHHLKPELLAKGTKIKPIL
jgi:fatty acid desaturase